MGREAAKDFRSLRVWEKAHKFVLSVYNYSDYFPSKEVHGLTPRLRLAAASVPVSLIQSLREADKAARAKLMDAARGSLEECRYYLILAKDLGYGDHPELLPQLEELSQLLGEYAAAILAPDS
jgi:four helix bundle protein